MNSSQIIQKEQLGLYRFSSTEVLRGDWEKVYRLFSLRRAERLGNNYKEKVRITFRTFSNEIKAVDTTVWSATDEYVSIKGGMSIPVKAILSVEF
jgi:hypothetical protein